MADLVRREQEQRTKAKEIMTNLNKALAEDHRLTQEAKQRQAEGKAAKEDEKKLAREAAEERGGHAARQAALKQLRDQLEGLGKGARGNTGGDRAALSRIPVSSQLRSHRSSELSNCWSKTRHSSKAYIPLNRGRSCGA
ncbi:MAG: hypothetical protein MZV70_50285 [Desulfobacterales bacterium]|nr:hypothetical protein [Desulfobacterales bacterium]